jgi:hypothetical protein
MISKLKYYLTLSNNILAPYGEWFMVNGCNNWLFH